MCWEEGGQDTGKISPLMIDELEIDLVIVDHYERQMSEANMIYLAYETV
jgi:triosephosphate isomerase